MSVSTPLDLTVVIPAFNSERTVAEAIASALSAGAAVLVVDDGSTDDTAAAARRAGASVIYQSNAGASRARSRGLQEVVTSFVLFLDADDAVIPKGLQRLFDLIVADPAAVGAIGGYVAVAERDGTATESTIHPWSEGINLETLLKRGHAPAPPSSVVWRTRLLREPATSLAPLQPRWAEDYEQLLRAAFAGPFICSTVPASRYRTMGGKSSKSPLASLQSSEDLRRYYAAGANIPIRERSSRDLVSLSMRRRAFGARGMEKIWWTTRSVISSPALYLWLIQERIRRAASKPQTQ